VAGLPARLSERPGWLSCRTASSAFYECKSLHIAEIRRRGVGLEGDSEQKKEEGRGEKRGDWSEE